MRQQSLAAIAISMAAVLPGAAHATNGMNLEGYGPLGMSMGGASMAYDSGLAAMMNNPATLGLTSQGTQMALALHHLGPDVSVQGMADSGGDSYFMPALGWGRKEGPLTYGVGMFAQGGMGTEYGRNSPFSMGTGEEVRSELGVGRLIFPVAYEVSPQLAVGASLDFVWAMLDVGMVADRNQVLGMSGVDIGAGNVAGISFSDGNDFTGKAKGTGWAGKLGLTYKLDSTLTLGASYHTKTRLNNLKTSATGASMTIYDGLGAPLGAPAVGRMTVIDFQWPETFAAGLAWQVTPKWMVAADIRRIMWADAMKSFRMSFNGMAFTMPQDWRNQNVYSLGIQYRVDDRLGLHAGLNYGKNPVPDTWLHPLFPAIVERHVTAGFDYRVSDQGCLAVAVSYAPEVSETTAGSLSITHGQLSAMLGYNHHF